MLVWTGVKRDGTCSSKGKTPACAKEWRYERSRMESKSCSLCRGGVVGGKAKTVGGARL